jgi:hypothetical protein
MANDTKGTPEDTSTPKKEDRDAQPAPSDTPTHAKKDTRTLMPTKEKEESDEYEYETKTNYPPRGSDAELISKETAEYKIGKPFHRCGICRMYSDNHCSIVRGYIVPEMGCKYYQKKWDGSVGITMMIGKRK